MNKTGLVVTAPGSLERDFVKDLGTRTTAGTLVDLIHRSKKELLVATPFLTAEPEYMGGESVFSAIKAASSRGVMVRLFLSNEGGRAFVHTGLKKAFKNSQVFVPSRLHVPDGQLGSHAKVMVADQSSAYVGSANMTTPGLHGHLEIGVLVEGELAAQCRDLIERLVGAGFFVPLTGTDV